MVRRAVSFSSLLAVLTLAVPAAAYDLKPIVVQLAPSGAGAAQMLMVTNSEDAPIALEAKAFRRTQNSDGNDVLVPENDDIIIVPPQMVVPAKSSQSFKVQWIGSPSPEKELAFRLVTEQLPVDLPSTATTEGRKADVKLQYRYEAALYITPPKSKPVIAVNGAELVKDSKGEAKLKLSLTSNGTRRAIIDRPELSLRPKSGGAPLVLAATELPELAGMNILAGSTRDVLLPWPKTLAQGPVEATLKTEYVVMN